MPWEVYVDNAANRRGSGVGLVLVSPENITIEKSLRLSFSTTNNEAEYETLLMGMMMVQKMGGKAMKVFSDLKLVVGQVRGDLETRDPRMQEYLGQVRSIQTKFECRLFGYPRHVLGAGFVPSNTCRRPMHSYFITPEYASDPPDQARSELDGFHITIPGKRYTA